MAAGLRRDVMGHEEATVPGVPVGASDSASGI